MVAGIKGIEPDRVHRPCCPKAQGIDAFASPTDHRRIDRHGEQTLMRGPACEACFGGMNLAAKADFVGAFAPFKFPRIAIGEPGFRQFDLPAVINSLAEHAIDVANAIAISRKLKRGEALHEAGG